MRARRLAPLVLLLLGSARVEAQGRVVPEPTTTRRSRVVPAPRQSRPRQVPAPKKQRTVPKPRVVAPPAAPVPTVVPAPTREERVATTPAPVLATGPGSELTVTLITFGIGPAVWERFGHNALWIHDASTGQDVAYNWGLFDFEQPGFLRRFLTGDTKYWMAGEDAYAMVSAYHDIGRPITLQTLNLTPAQALLLRDVVERNALEENKYYRYDYFRDNCSTRLRDALDRALGGVLRATTDTMRTALTYRSESLRLTEGDAPVQQGIDVALGRPADVPLSAWESFFIPMRLRDAVRIVNVPRPDRTAVPLVASERVMTPPPGAQRVVEARAASDHTGRNLVAGSTLAALLLLLRLLSRSRRWAMWIVALLGLVWSIVVGTLGVILLLAWLATKHVFWANNENLLLLSPVSVLLIVLIPAALLAGRAVRRARIVGAIVAGMGLLALALSSMPGGQPTRDVVALVLPMHLALAAALFMHVSRRAAPKPVSKE